MQRHLTLRRFHLLPGEIDAGLSVAQFRLGLGHIGARIGKRRLRVRRINPQQEITRVQPAAVAEVGGQFDNPALHRRADLQCPTRAHLTEDSQNWGDPARLKPGHLRGIDLLAGGTTARLFGHAGLHGLEHGPAAKGEKAQR